MGKVSSSKEGRKVVNTAAPLQKQSKRFAFDASKTLDALRSFAIKRDRKLRDESIKAYKDLLKNPPKTVQVFNEVTNLSFKSSLPVRVTKEAQDIIRQLKLDGATKILFPPIKQSESKVMYLDKDGKEQLLGIMRTGTIQVETDPKKTGISNVGLFIKVMGDDKKLLEFIIRAPKLPAILRSSKLFNQGGLTYQLRMTKSYVKKGGK